MIKQAMSNLPPSDNNRPTLLPLPQLLSCHLPLTPIPLSTLKESLQPPYWWQTNYFLPIQMNLSTLHCILTYFPETLTFLPNLLPHNYHLPLAQQRLLPF
jgi:hypothetical protein